jgi:hypothetical protein
MARNIFINPVTSAQYPWEVNHDTEEQVGKTRNITHDANTANIGFVRQQAPSDPTTLRYTGTILTRSQLLQMWAWYTLCETQTIYFQDFEGVKYEVIITHFLPVRKRVQRNPRDPANAPDHVWTYSIEMDVIRVVSGYLAGIV